MSREVSWTPGQDCHTRAVQSILMEGENTLLTVADAADMLDLTPNGVRRLSDRGDIRTLRTLSGIRLFRLADVKRLAAKREGKPRTGRPRIHPIRRDRNLVGP